MAKREFHVPDAVSKPRRSSFIPELDGLRAVAILLVFLVHVRWLVPTLNFPIFLVQTYLGLGWVGVDLFFVLSGFLITGILLDTRETTNYFSGFYARRTLRIFPLYYSVLIAVISIGMWSNISAISETLPLPADRWLYFTYLTNWLGLWKAHWGPDYVNFLAHFWSLAVEEQFYLIWPLMVWLIPSRFLPRVAGALAFTAAFVRWVWVLHSGEQIAIALATVCRMDSLFVGALAACIFRKPGAMQRIRPHLFSVATITLGAFLVAFSTMLFSPSLATTLLYRSATIRPLEQETMRFSELGGYSLLAVGFGALILLAADSAAKPTPITRILRLGWLRVIGKYSYGIYIFHVPLFGAMSLFVAWRVEYWLGDSVWVGLALVAALAGVTFGIAAASYELFERPILKLKRHFEPAYVANETHPPQGNAAASST